MITRKTLAVLTLLNLALPGGVPLAQDAGTTATTDANAAPAAPDTQVEPQATPDAPPYASRHERDQQLLAQALAEEIRWLDTPAGRQLGLFRPAETREKRGAVLILQGASDPPLRHPLLENPRRTLPRHGWATLALSLPAPPVSSPPPRPATDIPAQPGLAPENTQNTENTLPAAETPVEPDQPPASTPAAATTTTRETYITQGLQAALDWLVAENLSPVVLMLDASLALEALAGLRPQDDPAALVLLNLQSHTAFDRQQLDSLFNNPRLPLLDVFIIGGDNQRLNDTRQRHKATAERQRLENYRQLPLAEASPLTLDDHRTPWVEQLRGFMELKKPHTGTR